MQNATAKYLTISFPNRLEDILVLQFALSIFPADARAYYLLGNLWYDKRQYDEAISCWTKSILFDDAFPTAYRNLAIATYNKLKSPEKAEHLFEQAYQRDKSDARVLMELDQLYKRLNHRPAERLARLEAQKLVAEKRDDLYLEIASLHNFLGDYSLAFEMIMSRQFHPWEGGEGKVSGQYIYSLIELAKIDLKERNFTEAVYKLEKAQVYSFNLGEGKLPGAQENDIFYWLGCAYYGLNDHEKAILYWTKATVGLTEPSAAMFYNDQQPDKILYQGFAWEKLGEKDMANKIFQNLVNYSNIHIDDDMRIDYFAVSLPDLLIFEDDLQKRNHIHCRYISGLGYLGLQDFREAEILFNDVLREDAMHCGAQTHLRLLNELKEDSTLFKINEG